PHGPAKSTNASPTSNDSAPTSKNSSDAPRSSTLPTATQPTSATSSDQTPHTSHGAIHRATPIADHSRGKPRRATRPSYDHPKHLISWVPPTRCDTPGATKPAFLFACTRVTI